MKILKDSEIFTPAGIGKIEKLKNAVFVCETCLKGPNGWVNNPVAVFWNTDPANIPPGGSAWFGMFYRYVELLPEEAPRLYITNAISAVETPITGVVAVNDDVIYSRYRHDYRVSPDGTAMVDGGRDYLRTGPVGQGTVTLEIHDCELLIVPDSLKYWEKKDGRISPKEV